MTPCVPCPPPHPVPLILLALLISWDSTPLPTTGLLPNAFGRGGEGLLLSLGGSGGFPGKIRELISGSPAAAARSFFSVFLKAFPPPLPVSSDDVRKS